MPRVSCSPSSRLPSTPHTSARLRGLCGVESGATPHDVMPLVFVLVAYVIWTPGVLLMSSLGCAHHSAPTITKPG